MGREAKARKVRYCTFCEESIYTDAGEMREHTDLCARAKALGLITPRLIASPVGRGGLIITREVT